VLPRLPPGVLGRIVTINEHRPVRLARRPGQIERHGERVEALAENPSDAANAARRRRTERAAHHFDPLAFD
jgi:hypothetical protein